MFISYNWLKEFIDLSYTPVELDSILTMLGIEVESIIDNRNKFNNILVAEVIETIRHPKADKLSICKVNTGKQTLELICGAPNVAKGQKVFLGLQGAIVPQNNMLIESKKIRDIQSNGMIFSSFELGLDDDHSGIMVLDDNASIGTSYVDFMQINDVIFEIGVTPNRADCLSHIGIARELAAYKRTIIKKPNFSIVEKGSSIINNFQVEIEDLEKCSRYSARIIRNIKNLKSPAWLSKKLQLLGLRSINAVVDVTNYILYECGQPLHAFDLDKIDGSKIIIKTANNNEKFITLDSKERTLDDKMLLICDSTKPVAIGGVMGGENSEINLNTKNILIESAYFNPSSIRRTAKKLGISSDASYRFERGVDIEGVIYALERATALIADITEGDVDSGYIDVYPEKIKNIDIALRFKRANDIIGIEYDKNKIIELLEALQFHKIEADEHKAIFRVPSFRVDVKEEIDLIEEVARLYNYDNIEPQYQSGIDFHTENINPALAVPSLRKKIRNYLVPKGFNEILTQNQIDPKIAKRFNDNLIEISNPLGEELSVMRSSILPSILKVFQHNLRFGNSNLRLFEIGRTFNKASCNEQTFIEGIKENEYLILAISGAKSHQFWKGESQYFDFFDIKGLFEDLIRYLSLKDIRLVVSQNEVPEFTVNSQLIFNKDKHIGTFGELSEVVLSVFEIECPVFCLLLNLSEIYLMQQTKPTYRKIAPYPAIQRDIAFVVSSDIRAEDILFQIKNNAGKLLNSIDIFDIYKGKNIGNDNVSIAFSLKFLADDRTLTDSEIDESINRIVTSVESRFNAILRKF